MPPESCCLYSCNHAASVPAFFTCPISLELMRDPVSLCTGVSYDRPVIEAWLAQGHDTCPATMRHLYDRRLTPNHTLRRLIQQWCVANPSHVDIPSPKAPLHPAQVLSLSATLTNPSSSPADKLRSLQQLRSLSKDSESSKRCIKSTLQARSLVDLIRAEARSSLPPDMEIVQEAIGLLSLLTIDLQSRQVLSDPVELRMVARILERGSLEARVNAAQLVEVLAEDRQGKARVGQEDDIIEGLIELLRQDNINIAGQAALKASLKALLSLCQTLNNRVRVVQFNEKRVVNALVELLPGADRGLVERVVAVLDTLSSCAEGRAAISAHALAVPSVIRTLLNVSEMASEHAISVLWSVCINSSEEELLQEALQLGVLRKLLLVVQMAGFNPRTMQKAKDLLRLFSNFSDKHCSSEEI